MKYFLEGSIAVAEAVRLCKPGVISAYPITPQTHIVEKLADFMANGQLESQFVNVESEHSAASVVLGSLAAEVRSYTASSSQGLLLMSEVLYNIAGLRLPLVITCANRAVSAPLSIWNDQQDSEALRDAGVIQLYVENIQEAVDYHLFAFRLAEDPRVLLPVMVCMDGFVLTHAYEAVDIPESERVDVFLPEFKLQDKLDVSEPISIGTVLDPRFYMETRYAIQETMREAQIIMKEMKQEFEKAFERELHVFFEPYLMEDAKKVIISRGSVAGTVKDVVDEMRKEGEKVGALKVISYRPFPADKLYEALKDIPEVAVLDRAISLGGYGPMYTQFKALFQGKEKNPKVSGFIGGLGQRDITKNDIRKIYEKLGEEEVSCQFINLNQEYLMQARRYT
ncbi:pyruvate ferredoxin oxidoreductase [Candidatus Contubernalis alkaliaceticus]|uniref:pyruvate ferredoxin oxidoreductase n=1 Tax=Candidatus Contubernalis alkaliaceticus TaxID=338645 RepID=UPI001F4C3206|nr:pyruvate ferredoxin oxidoreductase [Candidatus Contubernalis alkalaceticus]UNC91508.1 pyruvate ferredoxin oxidoreductase [Candidatus Contubernalis alkalaceticus]